MKKIIISITLFFTIIVSCFAQKEYDSFHLEEFAKLMTDYNDGENFYDRKEYEKAIESYTKVFFNAAFHYHYKDWKVEEHKNEIETEFGSQFDSIGEIKLYYFSLYNIACCYSLLGNFIKAKEYLLYAIYAGYPYLNHIFADADMKWLFLSDSSLKSQVEKIYNEGNSKSLVPNKKCRYKDLYGSAEFGFDEGTVIYFDFDNYDGTQQDFKQRGSYEIKNYHILMHFDRRTYYQPDEWATPLGWGGIITSWTSYDPYPVYEDISYSLTFNWFYDYLIDELDLNYKDEHIKLSFYGEEPFKAAAWEEKDYTELRKKRNEEHAPAKRKIKRTDAEIAASAKKRRQKVLDYIEKVGKDDSTVFIVPDGLKELSWKNIEIPNGVVAVLIPEGVEYIDIDLPDTVKYVNLPSTLKGIYSNFISNVSELKILELPENIEFIGARLFSVYYDPEPPDLETIQSRKVYVPGWSDTPPDSRWHQEWDIKCHSYFGEYSE